MLKTVKNILKKLVRGQVVPGASPRYMNPAAFDEKINDYGRRGTKIGKCVQLLEQVDAINAHLVSIGDYTVVGGHSALFAHCPVKGARPCRVGSFVYLGYGVLVLPGVTIGDYCIVGAGSVVTKDVPSNSIFAGNPDTVVKPIKEEKKKALRRTNQVNLLFGYDISRPRHSYGE